MLYQLSYARVERPSLATGGASTSRVSARPRLRETPARLFQVLRQDLHVGQHGHEVGVPAPARDDVLVHVVVDPRACDAAEVPAEVVARGCRGRRAPPCPRRRAGGARAPPRRPGRRTSRYAEAARRADDRTSTGTCSAGRGSACRGARADSPRRRAAGALRAEDAAAVLRGARDVLEAPRRPQRLRHARCLSGLRRPARRPP